MNFKIETIPNYRVAYMRRVGPYGNGNIEVWENFKKWAKEKNLLKSNTILLAVQQDNPETTLPENCRFDACIVISEDYQIDDSISENELPGGKYMIYEVKHTREDIQNAYSSIFPSIQKSGYQIENKPIFE
ncbi:GyrI-like domain-containing protein, partial [Lysinibacillus telephonicus]